MVSWRVMILVDYDKLLVIVIIVVFCWLSIYQLVIVIVVDWLVITNS